jgi:hypothetical protein
LAIFFEESIDLEGGRKDQGAVATPDISTALLKRSWLSGDIKWYETEAAPQLSPKIVISAGMNSIRLGITQNSDTGLLSPFFAFS